MEILRTVKIYYYIILYECTIKETDIRIKYIKYSCDMYDTKLKNLCGCFFFLFLSFAYVYYKNTAYVLNEFINALI